MKTTSLVGVLALVMMHNNALAQPTSADQINIYSDPAFTSREALDVAPGTLRVFIVHEDPTHHLAVGSGFKIVPSVGFTGVWLSETTPFLTIGTSPNGILVNYGSCLDLPVFVLEVTYTVFGTSEECSHLDVMGHPDYLWLGEGPVISDCPAFGFRVGTGGRLTINPTASCPPVPVESSTWGKVKALYR